MPTYEYECGNCQHQFEEFQAMSDKPLRKCPKCGRLKLRRLIGSGGGIIFKGSGFYETDYKRKAQPAATDKSGSGDGAKSDSPPAKDSSPAKDASVSAKGDTGAKSDAGAKATTNAKAS
ncbi:MAG: zinc ribbon domain-containing protein [Planctomycetota bacterium]|jgi:putative FmdB family regulatory protein|nr:zinc ribbon domain-containing protein [Planctomycetota bacterium]